MKNASGIVALLALAGILSCKKDNNLSIIPDISFESISPGEVRAASSEDTVFLKFRVSDGDADLGFDPIGPPDVLIVDNRFQADTIRFFLPKIPSDIIQPGQGVQGFVTVSMPAAFLKPSQNLPDPDTTTLTFFIKDRAGHSSDVQTTTSLRLLP